MPKKFLSRGRPLLCLLIALLAGCGSEPKLTLTPRGTLADISWAGGSIQDAELLAMQNDTLFAMRDSIVAIPRSSLSTVSLKITENRSWMYVVGFAQLLPAAVIVVVADNTFQAVGAVMGAIGVGTWAALEFSGQQSMFRFPLDEEEGKDLALHLRFPYGVDRNRLNQVGALAAARRGR